MAGSLTEYLTGTWLLDRAMVDHRTGRRGSFRGRAEFTPRDDGLDYAETGEIDWAPHSGPASRRLRFLPTGPWRMAVSFADGRAFHDVDLTEGRGGAAHLCGEDGYDGEYVIDGPGSWRLMWHVTGPAKDLLIGTTYRRAADPRG